MSRKIWIGIVIVIATIAVWAIVTRGGSDDDTATTNRPAPNGAQVTASMSRTKVLGIDPQFKAFTDLMATAKTWTFLSPKKEYTLFVPSTAAWSGVDAADLDALKADPTGALATALKRHMTDKRLRNEDLLGMDGKDLTMLSGDKLPVKVVDGAVTIGGIKLAKTDIDAERTEIHVLDSVIPAPAAATP